MGEPIEWCTGQTFGVEHAGPCLERQIGNDDGRAALMALAETSNNNSSAQTGASGT